MKPTILAAALFVAGCANAYQTETATLTGYDAAVAAEIAYVKSGRSTPAEATKLRELRVQANKDKDAYLAALEAGASNAAALLTAASASLANFMAEANRVKGS